MSCLPAEQALEIVTYASQVEISVENALDLVESLGADAARVLEAILEYWGASATERKKIERVLKLAQSGGESEKAKAAIAKIPSRPVFVGEGGVW